MMVGELYAGHINPCECLFISLPIKLTRLVNEGNPFFQHVTGWKQSAIVSHGGLT